MALLIQFAALLNLWPNFWMLIIPGGLILLDFLTGVASALRLKTFDWKLLSAIFGNDFQKYLVAYAGVFSAWMGSGGNLTLTTTAQAGVLLILTPSILASVIQNAKELFGLSSDQVALAKQVGQDLSGLMHGSSPQQVQQVQLQPRSDIAAMAQQYVPSQQNLYGVPPMTPASPFALQGPPQQQYQQQPAGTTIESQATQVGLAAMSIPQAPSYYGQNQGQLPLGQSQFAQQ